jgi:hypothetical protein
MNSGAARRDQLVAQRALEGDVGDAIAVQVAELTVADAELDAAEAVVVGAHAGPGGHLVGNGLGRLWCRLACVEPSVSPLA